MFSAQQLESWLDEVANALEAPCSIYLIGGCAMCFNNLKTVTKDVDAIVTSRREFGILDRAILKAGFSRSTDLKDEFYLTALAVYEKGSSRIDVFLKEVGKMLKFTDSMRQRAKLYRSMGNLDVYTSSGEDIFLFKAMTPRPGDVDDCIALMRTPLDYEVIMEECMSQSQGQNKWCFWLYEKLCAIENSAGVEILVKARVYQIVKDSWKDRPSDFMSGIPNVEAHIPNRKLAEQVKRGES